MRKRWRRQPKSACVSATLLFGPPSEWMLGRKTRNRDLSVPGLTQEFKSQKGILGFQ